MMGWAIDGPVPTWVADGRRMLYTATSGAEGVGGLNDLKVRPLATPGQGIRVSVGTGLIRSKYVSAGNESYQGAVNSTKTIPTSPTTTNARTDLVVMRVEDPWADNSPWPEPSPGSEATYDAFPIRIIEGVDANVTRLQDVPGFQNDTAITLARIQIPKSTGTITAGMITDLREVAQPRSVTEIRAYNVTGEGTQSLSSRTEYPEGGQTFPLEAETQGNLDIFIPEWAAYIKYIATWSQLHVPGGRDSRGDMWIQVGATIDPDNIKLTPARWDVDQTSGAHRVVWRVAHSQKIPASLRGKTKRFYPRANIKLGASGDHIVADWASSFDLMVVFQETAD